MTSTITPTPASPAHKAVPALPPEWLAERFVKSIGRLPAALGRALDLLANFPILGIVIRAFSTVVFGLILLALIGLYIAIGSGFADFRASMEMTDLQFFDAWPMRVLLALLVIDLSVVTLRRIPLTLFKLGSWTVHIGILSLIAGSVWYFSCKEEGSVRIYQNQSVSACYNVTERALYAFRMDDKGNFDQAHPAITALPGLPIYYEHLAQNGNPLDVPLANALSGVDPALKDIQVRITGYFPSAIMRASGWRAAKTGETGSGPGIGIQLGNGAGMLPENWLVGSTPAGRLLEGQLPFGVEYLYHPTAQRLRDIQTSFDGPIGLTVRVPALNVERTYAVKPGVSMPVEGTPYTVQAVDMQPAMPMASKGYENTSSTALTVAVTRKQPDGPNVEFTRMALFRYPERSPDFILENGENTRKQDGVDPNIQIIFHDASVPQIWIVEEPGEKFSLIYRDENGKSTTLPLGTSVTPIPLTRIPQMKVQLIEHAADSVAVYEPFIIPNEQRPRSQTAMEVMQLSMLELEISGNTGSGAWKQEHIFVPFSPYAAIGEPIGRIPAVVEIPGAGKVGLLLATVKRDMPSIVTLAKFEPVHFAGATRAYQDYKSTLAVKDKQTGEERTLIAQLNKPATDHGIYYFQSAWDGDDNASPEKRFTVLGVANRPGVWLMTTGAILIIVGIGYAFYVKPILLKYKKESVKAWAESRLAT